MTSSEAQYEHPLSASYNCERSLQPEYQQQRESLTAKFRRTVNSARRSVQSSYQRPTSTLNLSTLTLPHQVKRKD